MKITFLGAARVVTGSCFLVETEQTKFLIDCGMFQGHAGENEANAAPFPFGLGEIDFLLLTHAHIDHSGRIPKLWLDGYRNPIYATKATADLCGIMLPDSGHIQEMDAEWDNRKRQRAGKAPQQPLYTQQDALDALKLFRSRKYDEPFSPVTGVRVAFRDAGHILGSSILELWVEEGGRETKAVFSGDLGYSGKPILRDPAIIQSADCLILESTYGNRLHENAAGKGERLTQIINETIARGGNIVIPSFAVGRTQELVYELNSRVEDPANLSQPFARIPVYIDSPLAVSATQIFRENMDCFDEEARQFIAKGDNPLDFHNLHFVTNMEQSKRLNEDRESKIIISASGMCDAGRIRHHLKHNLWRRESTILFVGYQAEGTLGRRLVEGAKRVKLFGEDIRVNARIEVLEGFSGHADREGLLSWLEQFKQKPAKVVLVHGETDAMTSLSQEIAGRFGIETAMPAIGGSVTLGEPVSQAAATDPKPATDSQKLAMLLHLEALREELETQLNGLKDELMKASGDDKVSEVMHRITQYEQHLHKYQG